MRQSLFANAGYLVGVEAVNSLVGFLFWGLATLLYPPREIGLASAVISAAALVALISGLGTGNGLIRFLPDAAHPNRMINSLYIFNIAIAFLVGGVFLAVLPTWNSSLAFLRTNNLLVLVFLGYGSAVTFAGSLRMTYLAVRQAKYTLWQAVSINGARLILLVAFAGLGVWGLVGSVWIAVSASLMFSYFVFLPRVMPSYRPRLAFSKLDLSLLLPYSFGIYIAFLLIQAPARLLPIFVLELVGPASAAHAQIAWLVGGVLVTPGLALATSAFVEASNLPDQSTSIFSKASVTGLLITFLAALFMILVAPWFLLLFGPTYSSEGTALLRWLSAAAPFVVLVGFYFSNLRFQKRVKRLVGLSAVVPAATLGSASLLTASLGISAYGLGWFTGYVIIAIFALREAFAGNNISTIKQQLIIYFSNPIR